MKINYPIHFPILIISNSTIEYCDSYEKLTTCTQLALKNGWFAGLNLIDSSGCSFTIKNAAKIGNVGRMWGYDIFFNQTIKVELDYLQNHNYSIDEVKDIADKYISDKDNFWQKLDEQSFLIIKNKIHDATNYKDLIDALNL